MGETTLPIESSNIFLTIVLLLLCILVVAFFSSSEASLISVSKIRIRRLAEQGHRAAQAAKRLWERHDRLFATILFTENLFIIVASSLGTALALLLFGGRGLLVASLVMTLLIVIFGEITPKTFAARNAERLSLLVARPMELMVKTLTPVIWLFTLIANSLISLVSRGGKPSSPFVTPEEIKMLASIGAEEGTVQEMERAMVQRVFEFGSRQVREVMTPRPEMVGVEGEATLEEFLRLFREASHDRFPVYSDDLDNLIGFVAIKDVLLAVAEGPSSHQRKVKELVRSALFVPESREVGSLFLEMRQKQLQMAIVIDEYGGTAGLVTLEELVEEIVGRLSDELVVEPELVKAIDERTVLVDASLRIDEANEELGLNLPEGDDYETIAGFILYRLRHIPREGEWMEEGNLRLTVGEMKGPKVEKVLISRP
jgi:CBS domain containing-hemolysin-like protein